MSRMALRGADPPASPERVQARDGGQGICLDRMDKISGI
jgi:hypothetical protein